MALHSSSDFVLLPANNDNPGVLVSNNDQKRDFVLVHESPISKRRELRASKELEEEDRSVLEHLQLSVASHSINEEEQNENDEAGVEIMPSPQRRPSFKNGRRVQEAKSVHKEEEPASPTSVDALLGKSLDSPVRG